MRGLLLINMSINGRLKRYFLWREGLMVDFGEEEGDQVYAVGA
jgi:hypothetical protein